MKIKLGLTSLKDLDMGKIVAAFDHEMKFVTRDCVDRPDDKTPREVVLKMSITPESDAGVCEIISAEFQVKSRIPPRQSRKYQMQVKPSGEVLVNPESPDDVQQGTLDELKKK